MAMDHHTNVTNMLFKENSLCCRSKTKQKKDNKKKKIISLLCLPSAFASCLASQKYNVVKQDGVLPLCASHTVAISSGEQWINRAENTSLT